LSPSPIAVEGLSKSYRDVRSLRDWLGRGTRRVAALNDVSLQVPPGEVCALVGPNGAGKSTLLRILATLVLPSAGRARVDGCDVAGDPNGARRRLGLMLEQERSFFARLSGRANLEFFAALHHLHGARARSRVDELLSLVGLTEAAERQFMRYSAGMQHRLGLARAMLHDPPVLLLDEPTRSLDPLSAVEVGRLLREEFARGRGKTILIASHSLEEVERVCDRVAILDRGRVLAAGTKAELAQRFGPSGLQEIYRRAVEGEGRG
jgi:ABC-2 type transport system ATP-binding protein